MTYEEVRIAALARALEFSDRVPTTRSVAYRRIAHRDAALAARWSAINADFFAEDGVVPVANGRANLATLPFVVARLSKVEVDTGTEFAAGTPVHLVPLDDPESAFPPRAFVRRDLLVEHDGELRGVGSLRVFYVRGLPRTTQPPSAASVPSIPEPYQELLVIDLARVMAAQTAEAGVGAPGPLLTMLSGEEDRLLAEADAFIAGYGALESRFHRTAEGASPAVKDG